MNDHTATLRRYRPRRFRTCYACGHPQVETRLRPFGRNVFGEPVTWVCDGCADHAHHSTATHAGGNLGPQEARA